MSPKRSFSEQLRQAVADCGTTRYSLAKQLGVPESSLSRFVAGKQGLSLPTLDKLVELLGLEFVGTVQQVARAEPRGRKKAATKEPSKEKTMMKKKDWAKFAATCAQNAHQDWFSSRRGTWYFEDYDVVVLYNNNPYERHPALRDEELAEFRERLRVEGVKELGFATFPESGYTYAMIIDASRDREQFLADLMRDITLKALGRVSDNPASG